MKIGVTIFFVICFNVFFGQTPLGYSCNNPIRFCSESYIIPSNTTGVSAPASSNYGCLGSQPNPLWYYLKVATSGPMGFTISASSDIDFICWGPFDSVDFCNTYDTTIIVDCSYSGSSTEYMEIPNAIIGKHYLFMVTGFSGQVQNIVVSQPLAGVPGEGLANSCSAIGITEIKEEGKATINNPFSEELIISGFEKLDNLMVYDILGKLVFEKEKLNSDIRINTKEWNSGVYNLIFQTKQGTKAYKIIKD